MNDEERYLEAKKRVAEIRGFYEHLGLYIGVNLVLIVINLLTSPHNLWFYWVTIFWGIFVVWNGVSVWLGHRILSKDWEERKIQEILEREK